MGYGDELMGAGLAKLAAQRGKVVAFGDGKRVIWSSNAYEVFDRNPKVVRPGDPLFSDKIEWIPHYKGRRLYHRGRQGQVWSYNPDFKAEPGEMFFVDKELEFARQSVRENTIVIEPDVKSVAPNKQWPKPRYHAVAQHFKNLGYDVVRLSPDQPNAQHDPYRVVHTPKFRLAAAFLSMARFFIGPEGGLHHAAAAFSIPGVVIFGGFTHPRNTGYDCHTNLFVGEHPCGTQMPVCPHCMKAMAAISVEQVLEEATKQMKVKGL